MCSLICWMIVISWEKNVILDALYLWWVIYSVRRVSPRCLYHVFPLFLIPGYCILLFIIIMFTFTIIWLLCNGCILIVQFLWFALHTCFLLYYMSHHIYALEITTPTHITNLQARSTMFLQNTIRKCPPRLNWVLRYYKSILQQIVQPISPTLLG